jgi:hypothetical protein
MRVAEFSRQDEKDSGEPDVTAGEMDELDQVESDKGCRNA